MPTHHPLNPFVLPGMRHAHQALEPKQGRPIETDYVQVDHSLEAFAKFVEEAESADALVRGGRLVVVTGNGRTGKTSVLKRCEHWVEHELKNPAVAAEKPLRPRFVDLSRGPGQVLDADELVEWAATRVIQVLENEGSITPQVRDRWMAWDGPDRLEVASRWLGSNAQGEARSDFGALLIELPPQDSAVALGRFARMAQPFVVLFCEYAPTVSDGRQWREEGWTSQAGPIEVRVGPLRPDDCERFINHRLQLVYDRMQKEGLQGTVPSMAPDVWPQFEGYRTRLKDSLSIGMLQRWMFWSYERALTETPLRTELSWVYLVEQFGELLVKGGSRDD